MSPVRLLFDENIPARLYRGVLAQSESAAVARVGAEDAPAFGTGDDALLAWCLETDRVLVTLDRATMPDELAGRLARHGRSPGVIIIRESATLAAAIEALVLVLEASTVQDWANRLEYLPF